MEGFGGSKGVNVSCPPHLEQPHDEWEIFLMQTAVDHPPVMKKMDSKKLIIMRWVCILSSDIQRPQVTHWVVV